MRAELAISQYGPKPKDAGADHKDTDEGDLERKLAPRRERE